MQRRLNPIVRWAAAFAVAFSTGCAPSGVPTFVVDPFWPEPLEYPNILGAVSGVTVAPDGNILVVTRYDDSGYGGSNDLNVQNNNGACCKYAPAVVEYAPDGSIVRNWGGPENGYPWPASPHGIAIDGDGNLWIGGGARPAARGGGAGGRAGAAGAAAGAAGGRAGAAGAGGAPAAPPTPPPPPPAPQFDGFVLKFSRTGEHLATYGTDGGAPRGNASMSAFAGANDIAFDGDVAYIADGLGNNRVAVVDVATGQITAVWGAYGNAPSDEPLPPYDPTGTLSQQFRKVSCVAVADGHVYVCDQTNNRIQVFETDGTYVNEVVIAPNTLGNGSVTDIAFSPNERFMYVADEMNERVYIMERETLTVLTSFGVGGRYAGHFRVLGGLAVDADGNVYTSEDGTGRRVQKFTNTGMGPVTAQHQGALWPAEEL